jgi:hypothetical protein
MDPKKRMEMLTRLQRISGGGTTTTTAPKRSIRSVKPRSKSIEIREEMVDLGEEVPVKIRSRSKERYEYLGNLPPKAIKAVLQQPVQAIALQTYQPPTVLKSETLTGKWTPYPLDAYVPDALRYSRNRARLTELLRNVLSDKRPQMKNAKTNIMAVMLDSKVPTVDHLEMLPDSAFHVIMNRLVRSPAAVAKVSSRKQSIIPPVPLVKSKSKPKSKSRVTLAQKLALLRAKFSRQKKQ